jgi:hypothetical protein
MIEDKVGVEPDASLSGVCEGQLNWKVSSGNGTLARSGLGIQLQVMTTEKRGMMDRRERGSAW